jgi:hypothetical protein
MHGVRYLFDVLKNDYGLGTALEGWSNLANISGISGDGRTIVGLGINPNGNAEAWVAYLGPRPAQLPGDYNANGTVDAADYVVWRKRGGTPQEYETWRAHFGATDSAAAVSGIATVPEPTAIFFGLSASCALVFVRTAVNRKRAAGLHLRRGASSPTSWSPSPTINAMSCSASSMDWPEFNS